MDDKRIVIVEFDDGEAECYGPFASQELTAEFVGAYYDWFNGLDAPREIKLIRDTHLTSPFRLAQSAEFHITAEGEEAIIDEVLK
jgi:hypothetical protein